MQRLRSILILFAVALNACADRPLTAPAMSDAAQGARAACDLTMTVADAQLLLGQMTAHVASLESADRLRPSQARLLRSRLDRASSDLDAARICQALNTLESLLKHVQRLVDDGTITADEAAPLIDGTQAILGQFEAAPQITFTSPANNSIVGSSGVITYTVEPIADHIECVLDGLPVACGPTSFTYAFLPGGAHTFVIQAFTSGGAQSSAALAFDVDATAPTVTSLSAVVPSPGTVRLTFAISDASDISAVECRIDGAPFQLCGTSASGAFEFAGLEPGEHLIEVYAFDIWGNSGLRPTSSAPPATFAGVVVVVN